MGGGGGYTIHLSYGVVFEEVIQLYTLWRRLSNSCDFSVRQ